jgi:hypothetical protein
LLSSTSELPEEAPPSVKKWDLRWVVKEMMDEEIDEVATRMSNGAKKGEEGYLKVYQSAWSEVVESLEEEKREDLTELAQIWNEAGPDPELQQK